MQNIDDIPADDERWEDAANVEKYDPRKYDFAWNRDFSRFIPLKLTWWDDASYIDYQARDGREGDEDPPTIPDSGDVRYCSTLPAPAPIVVSEESEDDIPF